MATGDKRIDFHLKKFLSVDQVENNFFGYLKNYLAAYLAQKEPASGIWAPVPLTFTGGSGAGLFTVAPSEDVVLMDNVGNVLELAQATGVDISFENANLIDYYVGVKFIEIPDDPETNPRYNTPKWKLTRDAVGELDDPDSISDQGGGVFRFIVNSITESGVDHSGRTCRVYLKIPTDLGDNYLEATVQYSGGNNYVDLSTGGALGVISTDETLYSAVIEGYTWKRNTDLSTLPEYAFLGTVQGKTGSPPDTFNYTGQFILARSYTDTDFLNLLTAFKLEHLYQPGSGEHGDITVDGITGSGNFGFEDLFILNDLDVLIGIDEQSAFTNAAFKVFTNGSSVLANRLFEARETTESGKIGLLRLGHHGDLGRLNIMPAEFLSNDPANPSYITNNGGSVTCAATAELVATVRIPRGLKATDIIVNASGTGTFYAYEGNVNNAGLTQLKTGSLNSLLPFSPELSSSEDNYLSVRILGAAKGDIYGVEITLEHIDL